MTLSTSSQVSSSARSQVTSPSSQVTPPSSQVTPPSLPQTDPSPQPLPPRKLPQHLRERWIVAEKPNPTNQVQSTLGLIDADKHEPALHHLPQTPHLPIAQYYSCQVPNLSHSYLAPPFPMMNQFVAQTVSNVLPYNMMPLQDAVSPMMYKSYSSY